MADLRRTTIEATALDGGPSTHDPVESEAIGSASAEMRIGSGVTGLREAISLVGAYDPTRNTWPICLIEAGIGKNRRRYSPKVLAAAAHLYEGLDVYDAHQLVPDGEARRSRVPRELMGFIKNVRFDPTHKGQGGLMGEVLVINPTRQQECRHPEYRRRVGFSHDVNVAPGRASLTMVDGQQVEDVLEIASATSVDFVLNPAAGGQFMEQMIEEVNMTELEGVKTSLADALVQIKALQEGQRVAAARVEVLRLLESATDLPLVAKHRISDNVVGAVRLSEDVKVEDLLKVAAETERKYLSEVARPAQPDNAGAAQIQLTESTEATAKELYNEMLMVAGLDPLEMGGAQ